MKKAKIKFGPAGIGSVRDLAEVEEVFSDLSEKGLGAAEIAFTYGVYIKDKNKAKEIGKLGKKYNINLSVHAPYWVNLNSKEDKKIEASKKRILKSAEIGNYIASGLDKKVCVVFHPGYYGAKKGDDFDEVKERAYENIRFQIKEMLEKVEKEKWKVELCPETMGKRNVFGSIDEIAKLVDETGCSFCIDFAHVLARYGKFDNEIMDKLKEKFKQKKWHCHFSGIEFGEKGEKRHKSTSKENWKSLLEKIKNLNKEIVIVNEAPNPVKDAELGRRVWV